MQLDPNVPLHYRFKSCVFDDEHVSARPRLSMCDECVRNDDAEIAGAATLDYRPRMHARHGQGAAAGQARPPRSKLSDFLHLWVNNIRLFYTWNTVDDLTPPLPHTMGNLQSDSKKKQKKKDTTAATVTTSASLEELDTDEDQKENKRDQSPKVVHDVRDEPREQIKISFEKVQTPGHTKRQAPQPPRIVLPKVPFLFLRQSEFSWPSTR